MPLKSQGAGRRGFAAISLSHHAWTGTRNDFAGSSHGEDGDWGRWRLRKTTVELNLERIPGFESNDTRPPVASVLEAGEFSLYWANGNFD